MQILILKKSKTQRFENYTKRIFCASFTIFIVTLTLITSGCDKIYESGLVPIPDQPVSGPVDIGTDWVEIVPPKPLKPISRSIVECIYEGASIYDEFSKDRTELIFADGRRTKIEAFLYDDKGIEYELRAVTWGLSFGLGRKFETRIRDGETERFVPDFPKDRLFVKLRIRSQIPIRCKKVEWVNNRAK